MKKIGVILLIIAFVLNISACFYLPSNFFAYIVGQVYFGVLVFCISMGCIYYRNNLRDSWLSVMLLSCIFSVLNVIVGILTMPQVRELADHVNSESLSVSVSPMTSFVQIIQTLTVNFVVITTFSFVVIVLFNRISKFKLSKE